MIFHTNLHSLSNFQRCSPAITFNYHSIRFSALQGIILLNLYKVKKIAQSAISHKPIKIKKRETGIEPATPSLARRCSTTEPLAHVIYSVDIYRVNIKYIIITNHHCQHIFFVLFYQSGDSFKHITSRSFKQFKENCLACSNHRPLLPCSY